MFITAITKACHLCSSRARSVQPTLSPTISLRSLNSVLQSPLGSYRCYLSQKFLKQNPVCTFSLHLTCHIHRPSRTSWFDHPYNNWQGEHCEYEQKIFCVRKLILESGHILSIQENYKLKYSRIIFRNMPCRVHRNTQLDLSTW